ncbi:MAG: UDP-N-acetylglucosamine pyrophosphorylase [Oscillospiraceae bacterium]|nr:UDP-N-acetylglucosamine pyrophosphorylase [Oscillospiraceae bacterium]
MKVSKLFEENHTLAWSYLAALEWPWEALAQIGSYIEQIGSELDTDEYEKHPNNVWIHKTATVAPSAYIGSSVIIGADTEVRHCAFIRKDALIGKNAVVGNSTELKNVILFDKVQVPHYNYVGDSILGYKSHLGAGAITSNCKNDHSLVTVSLGEKKVETGFKKFGAILGDHVEVGCNAVLNPGTIIGPNSDVYPLSMVRGFVPAGCIYKTQGNIVKKI